MSVGHKPPVTTERPKPPVSQKTRLCEHKYNMIECSTETIYADGAPYQVNVNAFFYCEKCLDIKRKHEVISYEL